MAIQYLFAYDILINIFVTRRRRRRRFLAKKGWGEKLINNGIHDVKQLKMLIPFHKSRAHKSPARQGQPDWALERRRSGQ